MRHNGLFLSETGPQTPPGRTQIRRPAEKTGTGVWRKVSCRPKTLVKGVGANICCKSVIPQRLAAMRSLPVICPEKPTLKNNQTKDGNTEPGEWVRPPRRGSPAPVRLLRVEQGSDGTAGEPRVRMAPGRGTVFVSTEQLLRSMPDRNHGNIETLRAPWGHAHGRWAI